MDILSELDRAGAVLLNRHFVYKSGKHGSGYINLDPVLPDVALMTEICRQLIEPFRGDQIDTVAAPAVGGIALAVLTASQANDETQKVAAVWADKDGDQFVFERAGFVDHLAGKRVLVVEDLLTTGDSARKVCQEAKRHGADVIGVSAICNRGGVTAAQLGVERLHSLAEVSFEAVPADGCELCAGGEPIVTDIGHGDKYQAEHPDYPGGYVNLFKVRA